MSFSQTIQYLDLPNIQTSLAVVNLLKLMDSGAIHFIGSLPFEAKIIQILQYDINLLSFPVHYMKCLSAFFSTLYMYINL